MMGEAPSSLPPASAGGTTVYDRMKRNEVEVLRCAGFSIRPVAKKPVVGINTALRILAEKDPVHPTSG